MVDNIKRIYRKVVIVEPGGRDSHRGGGRSQHRPATLSAAHAWPRQTLSCSSSGETLFMILVFVLFCRWSIPGRCTWRDAGNPRSLRSQFSWVSCICWGSCGAPWSRDRLVQGRRRRQRKQSGWTRVDFVSSNHYFTLSGERSPMLTPVQR